MPDMTYLKDGRLDSGAPDFGNEFYIQGEDQALHQLVRARSESQYSDEDCRLIEHWSGVSRIQVAVRYARIPLNYATLQRDQYLFGHSCPNDCQVSVYSVPPLPLKIGRGLRWVTLSTTLLSTVTCSHQLQALFARSSLNAGNSASTSGWTSGLLIFSFSLKPCWPIVICSALFPKLSVELRPELSLLSPSASTSIFELCCTSLFLP